MIFRNCMKVYDPKETKNVMMLCNGNSFDELFRKLIFSLSKHIYDSPNYLFSIIVNSTFFYTCAIARH